MDNPSGFMMTSEKLAHILARRETLGDEAVFGILRQCIDADLLWSYPAGTSSLIDCAKRLLAVLDDREVNHGSLIGPETLNAKNQLRLELSKWK